MDSTTGATRRVLKGHTGSVRAIAFSLDGATLASAADATVCLWEMPAATCSVSVCFGEPVTALAADSGAIAIALGREVCYLVTSDPPAR